MSFSAHHVEDRGTNHCPDMRSRSVALSDSLNWYRPDIPAETQLGVTVYSSYVVIQVLNRGKHAKDWPWRDADSLHTQGCNGMYDPIVT